MMSFAAMIGRRRQLVVPTPPDEPEEPPPPEDTEWPNEPEGFTPIVPDLTFDATFDNSPVETGTAYSYKGVRIQRFAPNRTQVVAGAGRGGTYALRCTHPAGTNAGYSAQIDPLDAPAGKSAMFVGWIMRRDAAFQDEEGYNKLVYPNVASPNSGAPILNMVPHGSGTLTGQFRWVFQQMQAWFPELNDGAGGFGDFNWPQNMSSMVFLNDSIYRMELFMQTETPNVETGPQDGIVRLWASLWNGTTWDAPVLIFERTDIRFGSTMATTRRTWANFELELYRGGSGNPTLEADAHLFFERLRWSTP